MRLRTQLVIASLSLIIALTAASLLIVQRTVQAQIRRQVASDVSASERALQTVRSVREDQLSRTASLLSELPTLKALMATQDRSTVQDGSEGFWKLSGGDAFLLATADGHLLAKHFLADEWSDESTAAHLKKSLERGDTSNWWADHGQLYWVFLHTLSSGTAQETRDLGVIAVGFRVDRRLAALLADTSRSEIAILAGQDVVATTIMVPHGLAVSDSQSAELHIGDKLYERGSVVLHKDTPTVTCVVLVPEDSSMAFLGRLNRTILALGFAAVLIGGVLFSVIAGAMTTPLENVVAGIRALDGSDYEFDIDARGSIEVEQLASAFSAMRLKLLESQKNKLAAERVAVLGRTASSISHDLRHYLSAMVANAEFLYEAEALKMDRDEIYREIKTATEQMVDLIDSLLELSREQTSLQCVPADIITCIERAVAAVRARQDVLNCSIAVHAGTGTQGIFDPLKVERIFVNLILNSLEAMSPKGGAVEIDVQSTGDNFTIRVQDIGPGINASVLGSLFEPFVSAGKQNGTGLGLAIAKKIVGDHGGSIEVESSTEEGTTMRVDLPRNCQVSTHGKQLFLQGSL